MNTTKNKFLMTIKEGKKKSISQIAAIGRKHKVLKYPILLFLVLYIFVYNFVYYFCTYFKMKERMAKAVAMAMCVILCVTSIDITAFAFTGEADSDKNIVGITSLSDEIANQKVKPDATLEDVIFPENLNVHVTYQVEKEIEVEVEEEKATPTPTPSATYAPSVEPTSTVEPTPSAETSPTEVPQGEEVDTSEENGAENQNVPEQNPPVEEQPEEDNQTGDLQSDATQNEDAENQPDGEQLAKDISGEYDSLETVYVSMGYFAAESSTEEIVVETLQKDASDDESGDSKTESKIVTKKEIIIEEVEEDVSVSATWSLDEENSSKAEFKDLEVGEKYIFVPTITEDGYKLADDVELPTITVTIGEVGAFEKSVTVDDVVITVTADEGVFPEGATIEARKVTESEESEVTEAIDEVRSEEKNVAVSYTFDITIYDKEGNEIEPDTEKGSVKVNFKMAEIANENLETDVYHVEETDEGLSAEGLDVNTEEGEADEAAVETEGFSFYTVEFTYGALQYVLEGDEKVELTTILDAVGIKENGEITAVEGSNDELFKPVFDEEEKVWYIKALKAFDTEEWLKVTVDAIEYKIVVTDAQTTGEWSKLLAVLNGTSATSVEGQFDVSSDADVTTIKLSADFTANIATTLTVNGNKKLDLNGHVINANKYGINVITVSSNATLNLCDSGTDDEHYYKYNPNGAWVWDDSATSGAITVDEITDSTAADTPIILKGGAVTGYNGSGSGGGVYNCGTLKMNGGNIVGNAGNYGGGIYSNGPFELANGVIVGNYANTHGAGVYFLAEQSEFSMSGGQIIYNVSNDQAGGLYLNKGTFNLNDGIISHNKAKQLAGGVSISGTMNMYDGEISYNKTFVTDGQFGFAGGVHNQKTMNLYGGRISNNSARYGAGIYNGYDEPYGGTQYTNPGDLTMTGGTVTENNCSLYGGGVYFRNGTITLGKTAKIADNTKGSGQDAVDQNVYLPSGMQIAIASGTDTPSDGMSVGVTMANGTGYFTTATATEDNETYFFADDSEKSVVFDSSKSQLQIVNGEVQKHDGIIFLAWTSTNSLPSTPGNYYLTNDVTLSGQWSVPTGETNLCLNGHVIKQGAANSRVIFISATAALNIYDCSDRRHYFTRSSESAPWVLDDSITTSELSVVGGVITGGSTTGVGHGAGIYADGKLSLYGGNIVGNMISNTTLDQVFGAGVFVCTNTGVFDMYGGSIVGNVCAASGKGANGGGVAVGTADSIYQTGTFNMYGGTISDNYAGLWAGGVNNWGTVVIKGGTITNNTAKTGGGGGVSNANKLTMTGGIIKNNNAGSYGGGVVGDGTVIIGGTAVITDNYRNGSVENLSLSGSMNFASDEEKPTAGMNVGVTTRKISFPASISVASDTDYSQYFTSDNDAYCIYYKSSDKMLYLAAPATAIINPNGGTYPEGSATVADWTYDSTNETYSKKGSKVTLPDAPTPPAYKVFKGWKYNSELFDAGTEVVFEGTETRTYTAEYENIGSSIKTFATPGELTDPNCFTLYTGRGSGIAQKVNFGEKTWYIAGKDEDGSLVLMSAPGNYANSIFGGNSTYSTSTVRDFLINTALPQFTTAERNMMQNTACSYVPAGGDKLYLANGIYDFSHTWITVGANNGIAIGMGNLNAPTGSPYTSNSGWFWLRVPYDGSHALMGYSGLHPEVGGAVHYWGVQENALAVIPAMNLNLSSVLFASSAPVASASTAFDDGMNFRIAAGEKIGSSATYTRSKVSVTKGTDVGDLYLYVQGKDSSNDWVWSMKVTENSSFDVSSIHDGADLTECAIWLETLNGSDRLAYAKEAGSTSPYTVTLDANGGSDGDESVEVTLYSAMPSITVPTKTDAVFMGYFDAAEGGVKYYNADGTSAKAWDKPSDVTLYAHWHTHSWTYIVGTGNDNHHNLYAVCSEPECEYYGTADDVTNAIALIVSVPSRTLKYDGDDFEATVIDTDNKWATLVDSVPNISYEYKAKSEDSYQTASNKKDAGYYKASITVDGKTAYVEYQIAKLSITPSVSIDGWTYGATPNTPTVTGNTGTGTVTYKYKKTSEADTAYTTTVPTACGEYTIKAEITETKNYNAGGATNTFAISKASRSSIEVNMSDYEYGADTAPTPSINPAASELEENPSVTFKYKQFGASDEDAEIWTGNTSALAVNSYKMFAVIEATDSYEEYTTNSTDFNVYKGEWKVTAPTVKTGLTYNCAEQKLVNAGIVENGGKLLYSTNGTDYSESIPQATNVREYTVYYKVAEDANHNAYVSETPITVTIAKADWDVTAPTAIAPSFTGSALELVSEGVVKDADGSTVANKMLYSLTGDAGSYSTNIPTATEVGSYTVYYKVDGDDNHNEYAVKSMPATIKKADRPAGDMPQVTMSGYTYGQTDSIPTPSLSATPSDEPTVIYYYNSTDSFEGASEWKNITATTLNAGNYYMFAKLSETASYRECHTEGTSFTVAKASCTVTAPTGKTLKYNGQEQELVNAGTVTGGTMLYSTDNSTYLLAVPTGIDQGTYTVYYKVVGDANHENVDAQTVTATIGKGEHKVTAPKALNPVYNGNEQVLISAGSCTTGTIKYSLDGSTYYDSVDSIKKAEVGSYTVYYKVEGNENYETYGPKTITAKIVKKSDPTPTPTPTPKPDPKPTPSPSEPDPQPNPQPTIPVTSTIQYAETGNPIKNYVANNLSGSNIPLPYITTDSAKAGWKTIDEALDAHKAKYKKNAVGTLSITMNGSVAVDTELITDAHEKKIPLSFALDDEVAIGIPVVNSVLSDQAKEGKATYFKVSSMTTAEAVSIKKVHAGLLPSDIVSIGGNENTPVVLTLCSNDKLSTKKSQLMTITFNAKKAGFKKGDRVYLYCGTSQIGISMYKSAKVDKNGFVTFSVPMVSNYWTIGSKNMKNKLLRNNVALPR